jgi:CubicO group peptidase (beta-lactamase class C family)
VKLSSDVIDQAIEEALSAGEVGLQIAAYLDGNLVVDTWAGVADQLSEEPVSEDTLFNVFSSTKAATNVALHIQAERGHVDYYASVAQYWPEFGCNGKEQATVYDVLTHRLGLPFMPAAVTPERMCDWDWMVSQIAIMHPMFEPGTRTAHMPYTYGWIVGEIVRRTDPAHRSLGEFVQEDICQPLQIDGLFLGLPEKYEPRVARLVDFPPDALVLDSVPDCILNAAVPPNVSTSQEVFGRSDVRQSCHGGAGGIMNAHSLARLFAMIAGGGVLDGVRLLSEDRVRTFTVQRPPVHFDPVYAGQRGSIGGFWLQDGKMASMAPAGPGASIVAQPGAGGSIGWADLKTGLSVAITHNRMFAVGKPQDNPLLAIGNAIRDTVLPAA